MFLYFLLLQMFTTVAAKPRLHFNDDIFREVVENDANLNPGYDIAAFRQEQLDLHNYYREKHGVPLMTLIGTLTQQAQSYAEELAANDAGLHHCRPPSCDRKGAGENLASGWGSNTTEVNATKAWYNEIWNFNFCNGGTRPGHEGKAIGHFTQVVWKTSIKLGIGYARTSNRKTVYVVGRYLKHGNVGGQYLDNVLKPSYIFLTFKDNCNGINGGLTDWSEPGQCSRNCGGGIQFKTKTCTNPKPSLNGRDCDGATKEIAINQWCNIQSCSGTNSYRNEQCKAHGYPAKSYNFGGKNDCKLHCLQSGNTYMNLGYVNDGTHCSSNSGACVAGVCVDMSEYSAPTTAPLPVINGGWSVWSSAGQCTRACGGGVQFKTRTCTKPKPSVNGRDCDGVIKEIAGNKWCNTQSCSGTKSHRDEQCEARGRISKSYNFGGQKDCKLYCLQSGNTYMAAGNVDDGTHCDSKSGACVEGVCVDMPDYSPPVINGGWSAWSAAVQCSRSCGGGVQLKTRTCTNPKPSVNGRDCDGAIKEIAIYQWCNTQSCLGTNSYRDEQCKARGYPAKSYNFGGKKDCKLYCLQSGNTYMAAGNVDDGTHCNSKSGACVAGVCVDMPDYSPPVINGGWSVWSAAGQCSRSCGGGVQFKTRTCANPKPSVNGRDCDGATKEIAEKKWCNSQSCSGRKSHRDQQCEARGRTAKSYNFGGHNDCKLYCLKNGNTYMAAGNVNDGTQCKSKSGACVAGVCVDMPDYSPPVINGGWSVWSADGQCSLSCGGGVQFKIRTCTNPKPSVNGRNCNGAAKEIAEKKWCNTQSCSGTNCYRDEQCEARGYPAKSHNFGGQKDCKLHCFKRGNTYMAAGNVDDGTHCNSNSGACVKGVCVDMPDYPPPGKNSGVYTGTPSSNIWDNIIFTVPNGATNVTITNKKYHDVEIAVGYTKPGLKGYNFEEATKMDDYVESNGKYEKTGTIKGVTFKYKRDAEISTIKIAGPLQPTNGFSLVLFVRGSSPADISWSYTV